jgi:hypothetical protein
MLSKREEDELKLKLKPMADEMGRIFVDSLILRIRWHLQIAILNGAELEDIPTIIDDAMETGNKIIIDAIVDKKDRRRFSALKKKARRPTKFGRTCVGGINWITERGKQMPKAKNKITDMDDDGDDINVNDDGEDMDDIPTTDEFSDIYDDGDLTRAATLAQRIVWIRDRVAVLGKDSDVGGKYRAISHDKVTGYIRPKLVQAGILNTVTCLAYGDHETGLVTDKGRKVMQHRAKFAVTFENIFDHADRLTVEVVAYADDYGDKAPGKALSYATKYALLKMFAIETGEEDEDREAEKKYVRGAVIADDETMLNDLWAVADELFGDDAQRTLKAMSARRFFVDSYGEIPQDRYDDALRALRVSKKQLDESTARHKEDTE